MNKQGSRLLIIVVVLVSVLPAPEPGRTAAQARAARKRAPAASAASGRQDAPRLDRSRNEGDEDDPDLPSLARGKIDKELYLSLREEQVNLLRGIPHDLPYNPRAKAIREMQRQEELLQQKPGERFSKRTPAASDLAESAWTPIGPAPIPNGQTTGVSNPVSGRVSAVAVHPADPNIVYAGTAQGGVYRTLDGGSSWVPLLDAALSLAIGAIAISPLNPTTVFVGTGEQNHSGDSFFGVGIYVIRNAETTADLSGPLNTGEDGSDVFSGNSISKILVDPQDDNTVFVSTGSGVGGIGGTIRPARPMFGLYRSTNALGSAPTFTRLQVPAVPFGRSIEDMVLEPGNPSNLLCTVFGLGAPGDGGVWRTTNALDPTPVFTQVLQIGTQTAAFRAALAINKVGDAVTVLAATGEPPSGGSGCPDSQRGSLRVSTDGGGTWSSPMPAASGFCGGQCNYNIVVAIDPARPGRIYLGGQVDSACSSALKRSVDGGATFFNSDGGLHADTHAIALAPSNTSIVYTGDDGGVFKSTDGGNTWTSLNNSGFSATQFQSIALHPTDPSFSIGGTQDNGTLIFGADGNWSHADFGDGGFALVDQNASGTSDVVLYHTYFNRIGTQVGFARVTSSSSAAPSRWRFFGCLSDGNSSNGIHCDDTSVAFYAPMALGPGNPNTVYFGTDRLYRSFRLGKKMRVVSQGPIVQGVAITSIGIAPKDDSVRIIGLRSGRVFAVTDGSAILTDVTAPSFPARYVARTVIDPNDSNIAYVTFSGFGNPAGQHVWKTTNLKGGADTWTPAGSGIPDVPVSAFAIDASNSDILYAGTDIGVYRSTDGGANWSPFSEGLPRVAVFDLAIHPRTGVIRIATHGRGVWERLAPGSTTGLSKTRSIHRTTSAVASPGQACPIRGHNLTASR